jgi:phytoene desaturase
MHSDAASNSLANAHGRSPSGDPAPSAGDDRPHAVVIGSGFGGLAAAVRLGARGYRVTVLERRDQPGGRAYVYRQDGFTFDGGPTVITAPFLLEELWTLAGRRMADDIDMRAVSPFYRIRFDDGAVFDYTGDADAMRAEIAKFNPDDVRGYEEFLAMSEDIFKVGFEQLAHVPFGSWMDMLKIVPEMMRLQSYRTVYGLVQKYVKDDRLRQVFSFHPLLVGGNPFATTSIYTLIAFLERKWGVWFPMGGTGVLIRGLVGLIEGQGGEVLCNREVKQIVVEGRRAAGVELRDGTKIAADVVVSNADAAWTYRELVPEQHRKRWTNRKIDKARYSMSLFVWYFGTKRKYDDVAHHTILLGPRYKGLLQDIFDHKVLADDFSLYLHRPTLTDPSLAPDGCDAFYVLSPVPHLDSGTDWNQAREPYRKAIAKYLSETILPGLEDEIVSSHVLDPIGFRDELLSVKGAAFSLEPVLTQSAYFRPHNRSEELDRLYIVGAGTHPGAGVPGVLSSARVLDTIVPDPKDIRPAAHAGAAAHARAGH